MRILLVDDEEDLISTLAERLSYRGLTVDWAVSGPEAMDLVVENHYDVVVVDMKMPKMTGIEIRRRLAALRPGMQYIFMSGHGSGNMFQDGVDAVGGADYYLLKPVDIDVLIDRIQALVKHHG